MVEVLKGRRVHPNGDHPKDALQHLYDIWKPTPTTEEIPLPEAVDRILVKDYFSLLDIPTSRAARMDGIAIRSADFSQGVPDTTSWKLGEEYAHADMGDDFDDKFDAVIAVEQVDLSEGYPQFNIGSVMPQPGECVNPKGGTLQKGRQLAKAGQSLGPNNLAILAMGGITTVEVIAKPKVAFIPTGTELVPFGETPGRGQVVDSNSIMAKLLLEEFGAEAKVYPIVKDDKEQLEAQLDEALTTCDIVLFNGGTSKGSEDFNKPMLGRRGTLTSHWMNSGPGRPVGAGVVDGKAVVTVPGPPAAMFNVMEYFVSSVIDHWYGVESHRHVVSGILTEDVSCPPHMMMLVNAELARGENGEILVTPLFFREDMVRAVSANGYLHSPIGTEPLKAGERVDVSLFGTRQHGLTPYPYC